MFMLLFGLYLLAHVCTKIVFILVVLTHLTVSTAPMPLRSVFFSSIRLLLCLKVFLRN